MSDANSLADVDLPGYRSGSELTDIFGADGTQAWLRYCEGRHALYTQPYRAVDHPTDPWATPIPEDEVDFMNAVCATFVARGQRGADWERMLLEVYNFLTLHALLYQVTLEGWDVEEVRVEVQEWRWKSWAQATPLARHRLRTCISQDQEPVTLPEAVGLIGSGLASAHTHDIDEY